jgi:UDP-N-acetylmuramate: L-alanyl-gamma-D-glutamyl-meso-diaminopimelate ligase
LHTFSSLNPDFLPTYAGALNAANAAAVYYDPSVVAAKRLPPLSPDQVREAFQRPDLEVFTVREDLVAFLNAQPREDAVVVLMSSGWFGGAVWPEST